MERVVVRCVELHSIVDSPDQVADGVVLIEIILIGEHAIVVCPSPRLLNAALVPVGIQTEVRFSELRRRANPGTGTRYALAILST